MIMPGGMGWVRHCGPHQHLVVVPADLHRRLGLRRSVKTRRHLRGKDPLKFLVNVHKSRVVQSVENVLEKSDKEAAACMDVTDDRHVEVRRLGLEPLYDRAIDRMRREIDRIEENEDETGRGCVRLEVELSRGTTALMWLRSQLREGEGCADQLSVYFSPRLSSAPDTDGSIAAEGAYRGEKGVAGIGTAWLWKGQEGCALQDETVEDIKEFVAEKTNQIRVYGGGRFDAERECGEEWKPFGSFCFMLPRIEFVEMPGACTLACTLAWDSHRYSSYLGKEIEVRGYKSRSDAIQDARSILSQLQMPEREAAASLCLTSSASRDLYHHQPSENEWRELLEKVEQRLDSRPLESEESFVDSYSIAPSVALDEYLRNGQKGLDDLLAASKTDEVIFQGGAHKSSQDLIKLVLARKTSIILEEKVQCCDILAAIQEKDPKAYQFLLRLPTGQCFLGCTPERLYARTGDRVVSEAVAGTRGRGPGGDIEKDFWLAFDLLQSQKDGLEFRLVRESILRTFRTVCEWTELEVEKSILKQGSVQHLYSRIAGKLKQGVSDADLIHELHPTPAVCGQPDDDAMKLLRTYEPFDRGYYSGPFGWFSHDAADIAVAIRSSLVENPVNTNKTCIGLYAGVGIVPGSTAHSEWNELDLKIGQFTRLLQAASRDHILSSPNLGTLAARMIIDELCRSGCNTFCVAPGSRSSPLTLAAVQHPRAKLVPGIDERSLGFWALGHSKARGRPCVVITSSGTAVANLLPAVVEASLSNVPIIMLTADRPAELRDSGSNQTIKQVGIFGSHVRWEMDLQPPTEDVLLRHVVGFVSDAIRRACSASNPGPVHLNCQFREPLNLETVGWSRGVLSGLEQWMQGSHPLTACSPPLGGYLGAESISSSVLNLVEKSERGLLVLGEMQHPADVASAVKIASDLGWPVMADILSGARLGGEKSRNNNFVNYYDHILLDEENWPRLKPDVVLHLGSRITSKRLLQFLEWTAGNDTGNRSEWILVSRYTTKYDPSSLVSYRLECTIPTLQMALEEARIGEDSSPYAHIFSDLDIISGEQIRDLIDNDCILSEVQIAHLVSKHLPANQGLFVGNSMPIRDLDMFATSHTTGVLNTTTGNPIAANRGASGIDGVLSTAAGFADGLGRKSTLVIGDVSFLHDANGLNLLRTGAMHPPLTIVLINNSGGGIFNFLPISADVPEEQFRPLWTTPQHVDIAGICRAQGIPHVRVTSLRDLEKSLQSSWQLNRHCVLEVVTDIRSNMDHHNQIKERVMQGIRSYFHGKENRQGKILNAYVESYSIPLHHTLTTGIESKCRQGIYVYLDVLHSDGTMHQVMGDVAPLEGLHEETLPQARDQCEAACNFLSGRDIQAAGGQYKVRDLLSVLEKDRIGSKLFPSVKCGVEAALWSALSYAQGSEGKYVRVSALLDPQGRSNAEIKNSVLSLVNQGYRCIKIKVGRHHDPQEEAKVIELIRNTAGDQVTLRADANQRWTWEQALQFAEGVSSCGLQYLEEPLQVPQLLFEWQKYSSLPIALDESIDQGIFNCDDAGASFPVCATHVILKPSLLGGFTRTMAIATAAERRGLVSIISSSFESPIGLLHLATIASSVDAGEANFHGIATESWFSQEHVSELTFHDDKRGRLMPGNVSLTYGKSHPDNGKTISLQYAMHTSQVVWRVSQPYPGFDPVHALQPHKTKNPIVILHGMFGASEEMMGLASQLCQSTNRPVLNLDLPAHGLSSWKDPEHILQRAETDPCFQLLDLMAESLTELLQQSGAPCTLVGYSMGARIALRAAALHPETFSEIVMISGSFGIDDAEKRSQRMVLDAEKAAAFEFMSRVDFLRDWYDSALWDSLRESNFFEEYLQHKASNLTDHQGLLSLTLCECSPGKTAGTSIEEILHHNGNFPRLLVLYGVRDSKYAEMGEKIKMQTKELGCVRVQGISQAGHATHVENLAEVVSAIAGFLTA